MKKSIQKILSLVLTAMILLGCLPAAPAMADSMEVFAFMDSYTEGEGLEVMWYNDVEGAVRYDCTVKNTTTGAYPRSRSASDTGYSAYVSGSLMTAGDYRVWVGAVNANGDVIVDGYKTFTVSAVSECDHEWSSRTGCCKLCDEECPHNNGYYEVETACTGTSISDTQHKLVWTYDNECVICRYAVSTDKTKTETGSHQFDSNGDCTLCNYRAACKHTSTVLEEISRSYSQYNETYHKVKTASSVICANANCGKEISYGSEIDTFNEEHTMVDGVCEKCNYAVTYEKMTTVLKRGQTSSVTGSGISATCSTSGGTGYYRYYWFVYHNGVEIYSTGDWTTMGSYPVTEPGSYTFAVRVEDRNIDDYATATSDVITVTEAVCAHANTAEEKTGEINYVKLSDSKHTIQTYYRKYCLDCGEELSEYYRETQEAHSYVDGNCSYCSAAEPTPDCTHPDMTSREISRSIRAYTSDEKHAVDITWEDRCASCGVVLNTTRVTSETEAHTFSGSACSKCGFVLVSKACDHVNKTNEYVKTEYWSYDSAKHVVSKTYRIVCQNSACDVGVLNDKYVVEEYENHQLSDNTCTVCGYRVSCTHPQTTRKGRGTDYIVLNENKHIARTTYELYCKECSALLDDNYQEDAHFDHVYENGQCKYCHYKEALDWSESVLAPKYVNESLTHHKVIETVRRTYTDGTYSDSTTERFEEHAPTNPSDVRYETKHPHKEFYVCKCGAHPYYDGQYRMANGQMQDQNACCICLGHAWQAPQQVNGQWRETCSRCGKSRNASEPVHEHDFSLNITAAPEHPHQVSGYCSCGEFTEFLDVYGKLPNCCQCMGHDWDTSYYGGYAHDWCLRCGEWVERKTAETEAWQDYVDLVNSTRPVANQHKEDYDVDKTASSLWRLIALQATNKLTEADFVFGTTYLEALQNPGATLIGENEKVITADEFDAQQKEIWKKLIVEMLQDAELGSDGVKATDVMENVNTAMDIYDETFGKGIKSDIKLTQKEIDELSSWMRDMRDKQDIFTEHLGVTTDPNYALNLKDAVDAKQKADKLDELIDEAEEQLKTDKTIDSAGKVVSGFLTVMTAAAEGSEEAARLRELQDAYGEMTLNYQVNKAALVSIISDAKEMGNTKLAEAAQEVLDQVEKEYKQRTTEGMKAVNQVLTTITAGVESLKDDAADFVLDQVIEQLGGSYMGVVSLGATALDLATNHSEVYESAEELMALATMSSGIDLHAAVENEDGTDYIYKLWANLQAKGCEQAVDFIDAHEDDGWGQVTIDELGIPAKDRNDVYDQLNNEKSKYQSFGSSRVGIDQ